VSNPADYRPAPGSVPEVPGVYKFRDRHGRVVYVGKAKNLRARLGSYFHDVTALHPRTQSMVTAATAVEWTIVATEVEALQLEYTWIKEFSPRFNVRYRDDKSYPSLAVTVNEEFPRLQVMRGPKRKGVRYFGPYSHAWAIRETLDLLLRVFPARTCSRGVFRRAQQVGRPCLLGYIDKCSAPCVGRVSMAEHRRIVDEFCDFMAGQTTSFVRRLERQMTAAADEMNYERAARLRDDIGALRQAMEKNAVVLGDGTDADVIALAEDELEAAVQVFYVRDGRIRGQRGWVVEKVDDVRPGDLVESFLQQAYGGDTGDLVPREVLVPSLPTDRAAVVEWLSGLRRSQQGRSQQGNGRDTSGATGGTVDVRVPQRGDKRALMETVRRNAQQSLVLHKTRRAGDLTTRSQALAELQQVLNLAEAPLRIECFDVSNLQGTEVVASMVVFEDGLPRKSEYRRFTIAGVDGQDDTASIHEVIRRRFVRQLTEAPSGQPMEQPTGAGRSRRFAYPPQLVVVDGGAPQVAAANRAMTELGVSRITADGEGVELIGLAKRMEEVWRPGSADPLILPRSSEGLYLLQRVRDEAHRFAIAFHRAKRSSSMTVSALDAIPGLGAGRRTALIKHFGSVRALRVASVDEIAQVPGFGPRTAAAIVDALTASPPLPASTKPVAVNTATGEIIDTVMDGRNPTKEDDDRQG
jgi:excinuclease ABC subunit C